MRPARRRARPFWPPSTIPPSYRASRLFTAAPARAPGPIARAPASPGRGESCSFFWVSGERREASGKWGEGEGRGDYPVSRVESQSIDQNVITGSNLPNFPNP